MRRRQSTGWSCSAPGPGTLVALAGLLMSAPAAAPSGSAGGTALAQYVGSSHSAGHHAPAGYGATWGGSTAYHNGPKTGIGGGGFVPYYGYGLGLPYGPYYYGSFALGPVFVPADSLFGPGPLMAGIGNLVPADDGGMANPPGPRNRGPLAGPAPKNAGLQNAAPQNPLDPPAPKKSAPRTLRPKPGPASSCSRGTCSSPNRNSTRRWSAIAKVRWPRRIWPSAFFARPLPKWRWVSTKRPPKPFSAACGSSPTGPMDNSRWSRCMGPSNT